MSEPAKTDGVERAARITRKVVSVIGTALAIVFAFFVLPFWALGAAVQAAWMAFEAGRKDMQSLDKRMKP